MEKPWVLTKTQLRERCLVRTGLSPGMIPRICEMQTSSASSIDNRHHGRFQEGQSLDSKGKRCANLSRILYLRWVRMPLMIIGRAWKPHPFNYKNGTELGFDYHADKKAWITKVLFVDWLRRLHWFIGQTLGQKISFVLDNYSANGKRDFFPNLQHVHIEYLPPKHYK